MTDYGFYPDQVLRNKLVHCAKLLGRTIEISFLLTYVLTVSVMKAVCIVLDIF